MNRSSPRNTTHILSKDVLICPICYAPGECVRHCVEIWLESCRTPHLEQVLEKSGHEKRKAEMQERYAVPELCISGSFLVCWENEDPDAHLPLFTGAAIHHSGKALVWTALFHRSGTQLLQQYRDLVLGQLNKAQNFQRILKTLHQNNRKKPSIPSVPPSPLTAQKDKSNGLHVPIPVEEEHDVQKLMDDLMNNLI